MKYHHNLTRAWVAYFNANYEWDYAENQGDSPKNLKDAKRRCKKIEKVVTEHMGQKVTQAMIDWAADAYERVFYQRGPSKKKLLSMLPKNVDPKAFAKSDYW